MMSRFIALLCLSAVGCLHDARPVETVAEERTSVVEPGAPSSEPRLQPASFEGTPAPKKVAPREPAPKEPISTMSEPASPPDNSAPSDSATQPDNTKVNERDRGSDTLTPLDQGNGEDDLKLTQAIRQAVMADKALSFTGKNVKIITKDGKVTLRGPVKTAEERAAIEADARRAAGSAPIDNQIEVKK